MPVAACSNRTALKILGTSQVGRDEFIIHFFQDGSSSNLAYAKPIEKVVPSMFRVSSMEVSQDEEIVYIGGIAAVNSSAGQPVVTACQFNSTLNFICGMKLTEINYGAPTRMKRILSTEILIMACDRHFAIVEYVGGAFNKLGSIENVHNNQISDFVLFDRFIYSTAVNEARIVATQLGVGGSAPNLVPANPVAPPRPVERQPTFSSPYNYVMGAPIRHPSLTGLEKVDISPDGTYLYTGGNGLHIFKKGSSGFAPFDIDEGKVTDYMSLRCLPNGDIAIQEPRTNDFTILNELASGQPKVKIAGKQEVLMRKFHDLMF